MEHLLCVRTVLGTRCTVGSEMGKISALMESTVLWLTSTLFETFYYLKKKIAGWNLANTTRVMWFSLTSLGDKSYRRFVPEMMRQEWHLTSVVSLLRTKHFNLTRIFFFPQILDHCSSKLRSSKIRKIWETVTVLRNVGRMTTKCNMLFWIEFWNRKKKVIGKK